MAHFIYQKIPHLLKPTWQKEALTHLTKDLYNMMLINFTKMHGLGNDFVVIDLITQPFKIRPNHIKRIADRRFGIGCDQVLLIEPPIRSTADFSYRIFNADGQEVEQCGNGIRCVARFFYDMGFTNNHHLKADCLAGPLECVIEKQGQVTVNMGIPKLKPVEIPFIAEKEALQHSLILHDAEHMLSVVSMGNPHAVLQYPSIEEAPVEKIGALISKHAAFPQGVNVGFMQICNRSQIRLRVFERGVGETHACGTGACAAVVSGILLDQLDNTVEVEFTCGALQVSWQGPNTPVYMTGPANSVFVGRFRL